MQGKSWRERRAEGKEREEEEGWRAGQQNNGSGGDNAKNRMARKEVGQREDGEDEEPRGFEERTIITRKGPGPEKEKKRKEKAGCTATGFVKLPKNNHKNRVAW